MDIPAFFFIPLFIVIAVLALKALMGAAEWANNNSMPVCNARTKVTGKRTKISGGGHHGNNSHHSPVTTEYFATFEFSSGTRTEFDISEDEFAMLSEGDTGTLTYQGTRYHGFSR